MLAFLAFLAMKVTIPHLPTQHTFLRTVPISAHGNRKLHVRLQRLQLLKTGRKRVEMPLQEILPGKTYTTGLT